jgi:hypothetical protein
MREIDINHLMSQLGISAIEFINWKAEEKQHTKVESPCIVETPVNTFKELMSDLSTELSL